MITVCNCNNSNQITDISTLECICKLQYTRAFSIAGLEPGINSLYLFITRLCCNFQVSSQNFTIYGGIQCN